MWLSPQSVIERQAAGLSRLGSPFPGWPVPTVIRSWAAPVTAVVIAIEVAVVVVMAAVPFPVVAPTRVPPLARAPVVIRQGCGLSLCVDRGADTGHTQRGAHGKNRCRQTWNRFHKAYFYPMSPRRNLNTPAFLPVSFLPIVTSPDHQTFQSHSVFDT